MNRIGTSRKVTTCQRCGKRNLRQTIAFQRGRSVVHLGSECAKGACSDANLARGDELIAAHLAKRPGDKDAVELLLRRDPSGTRKYLRYELALLAGRHALAPEIADTIDLFHKFNTKVEPKDINQHEPEAFNALRERLFAIEKEATSKRKAMEQHYRVEGCESEIIYENDSFLVRLIKNKEASVHYGQETTWCIRLKTHTYYEDYESDNIVHFFILSKHLPKSDPMWKVAASYERDPNNAVKHVDWRDANNSVPSNTRKEQTYGESLSAITAAMNAAIAKVPKSILAKIKDGSATEDEQLRALARADELLMRRVEGDRQIAGVRVGVRQAPKVCSRLRTGDSRKRKREQRSCRGHREKPSGSADHT